MLTPKLGAESIFNVKSIKYNLKILGAGQPHSLIVELYLIDWRCKMNATPSFGVSMKPEVPSKPQLTLV